MPGSGLLETGRLYLRAFRNAGRDGISMRMRLFGLLMLFCAAIVTGVLILLMGTGAFHAGEQQVRQTLEQELSYRAQAAYQEFGDISVRGVDLAETLSQTLERRLAAQKVPPAALAEEPELLNALLEETLPHLTGALEKTRASGVFLVLDATVNPDLPDAQQSRAGLYLKNMEPNIVSNTAANLRYMIGPMSIARENGMYILPQWRMECDVSGADWYQTTLEMARSRPERPVSRLYRWNRSVILPGSSESVMLCTLPLTASDGTVMGVCGFEVSQMLFKLSYAPDNSRFEYLFCMLSPVEEGRLSAEGALYAGSYAVYPGDMTEQPLEIKLDTGGIHTYQQPGAGTYAGLHRAVELYPKDSVYAGEQWMLTLMMPGEALAARLTDQNRVLVLGLLALLVCSCVGAAVLSRRYLRPMAEAFRQIKEGGGRTAQRTRIPEIDDLLEFLFRQDETAVPAYAPPPEQSALYRTFVENIQTLSAAERAVFDLYLQGHTAREIAAILCLSINTIKTHNRRIYMKLNVTSRKELLVYIQMMEEAKQAHAGRKDATG